MATSSSSFLKKVLYKLFGWVYRFYGFTLRWQFVSPKPALGAAIGNWHQELFMDILWAPRLRSTGRHYSTMVSSHQDGEYAEVIARICGLRVVRRGRSTREVRASYQELVKIFTEGISPVFTVDGPLGPYHKISDGLLIFAHQQKVPLVIVMSYPQRAYVFHKSWDRFLLPFPFTRVYCYSTPAFSYDKKLTLAENRKRLQAFAWEERVKFFTKINRAHELPSFAGPSEKPFLNANTPKTSIPQ